MMDKIQKPYCRYYIRMGPYSYDSRGQIGFLHLDSISVYPQLMTRVIRRSDPISKANQKMVVIELSENLLFK